MTRAGSHSSWWRAARIALALVLCAMLATAAGAARAADDPILIPFQGRLADDNGNPRTGEFHVTFEIFDAVEQGASVGWTEVHDSVSVNDGVINVLLGSVEPLDAVTWNGERYLEITIRPKGQPNFPPQPLKPRHQIVPAHFARAAALAYSVARNSIDADKIIDGSITSAELAGSFSIELETAGTALPVTNTGIGSALSAQAQSGTAVVGAASTGDGVRGESSSGTGVYGRTTSGQWGVLGETQKVGGRGVAGLAPNGVGVRGLSQTGNGVEGESTSGIGVYGKSPYIGVFGESPSTAVRGDSGSGNGIYGLTYDGQGVYGYTQAGGVGVRGFAETTGVGVQAISKGSGQALTAAAEGSGAGVSSFANTGAAIFGNSIYGDGVVAYAGGTALTGTGTTGVHGIGDAGYGVQGESASNIGVRAVSNSAVVALQAYNAAGGDLMDGWVTIDGNTKKVYRVGNDGDVYGRIFHPSGADIAEHVSATGQLRPGDVVEIDPLDRGAFRIASTPYSTLAAGIVSTSPGIVLGGGMDEVPENRPALALGGRVPAKVTAANGAIGIGDLLTTSAVPGHAMRCEDRLKCAGAIVGKALETLDSGNGMIQVLVTLQ
jgi:hypothetical protein